MSRVLSRIWMTLLGIRRRVEGPEPAVLIGLAGGGIEARSFILLGPRILGREICLLLFACASCDACKSVIDTGLDAALKGLFDPYEDFGLPVLVPALSDAGGLMPELRLPVYDELDVFLDDIEPVREIVDAFEELRHKVALETF